MENFSSYLDGILNNLFIARMEGNQAIISKVMNDAKFRSVAHEILAYKFFIRFERNEMDADNK